MWFCLQLPPNSLSIDQSLTAAEHALAGATTVDAQVHAVRCSDMISLLQVQLKRDLDQKEAVGQPSSAVIKREQTEREP